MRLELRKAKAPGPGEGRDVNPDPSNVQVFPLMLPEQARSVASDCTTLLKARGSLPDLPQPSTMLSWHSI